MAGAAGLQELNLNGAPTRAVRGPAEPSRDGMGRTARTNPVASSCLTRPRAACAASVASGPPNPGDRPPPRGRARRPSATGRPAWVYGRDQHRMLLQSSPTSQRATVAGALIVLRSTSDATVPRLIHTASRLTFGWQCHLQPCTTSGTV
jgi:hypothetical protein